MQNFVICTIRLFCKMLQINSINSALQRHGFFGATPMCSTLLLIPRQRNDLHPSHREGQFVCASTAAAA